MAAAMETIQQMAAEAHKSPAAKGWGREAPQSRGRSRPTTKAAALNREAWQENPSGWLS